MVLTVDETRTIYGGANISYSMINAITKMISTIFDLGQMVGSAFRRMKTKNYCK